MFLLAFRHEWSQLAAALRSRSPDELPELLGAYRGRRFSYRCCLLRNRETAQIAVRDALTHELVIENIS